MLRIMVGVFRFITGAVWPRSTAKLQFSVCLEWPHFTSRKQISKQDIERSDVRFLRVRHSEMHSAHVARKCRLPGNPFDLLRVSYAYAIRG